MLPEPTGKEYRQGIARLEAENKRLREALEFYADPLTYHAIGFMPDRPCGDFIEDFEDVEDMPYGLDPYRPGKCARAALDGKDSVGQDQLRRAIRLGIQEGSKPLRNFVEALKNQAETIDQFMQTLDGPPPKVIPVIPVPDLDDNE